MILAEASAADDWKDRDLGPIHILKYLYLADLHHAVTKGGTITGADWAFFHFGPWSTEVHAAIPAAAARAGADYVPFEGEYGESKRWRLRATERERDELYRQAPSGGLALLRADIRRYGKATEPLLDYVYKTPPMVRAQPGDRLVFPEKRTPRADETAQVERQKLKDFRKKLRRRSDRLKAKLEAARTARDRRVRREPVYDEVFEKGVAWLDADGGEPLPSADLVVEVDDAMWSAPARRGEGG